MKSLEETMKHRPPELLAKLGPVGRRFLGFNVRMPTSLEEYYLPEEQRLYQRGQG